MRGNRAEKETPSSRGRGLSPVLRRHGLFFGSGPSKGGLFSGALPRRRGRARYAAAVTGQFPAKLGCNCLERLEGAPLGGECTGQVPAELAVRVGLQFGRASLSVLLRDPPTAAQTPLHEGRTSAPHAQVVEVVQHSWGPGAGERLNSGPRRRPRATPRGGLPSGPPLSGPRPCPESSPGPRPLPYRGTAPFSRGPALTGQQHQGAGAPAQVGGHQVGYLWPRV